MWCGVVCRSTFIRLRKLYVCIKYVLILCYCFKIINIYHFTRKVKKTMHTAQIRPVKIVKQYKWAVKAVFICQVKTFANEKFAAHIFDVVVCSYANCYNRNDEHWAQRRILTKYSFFLVWKTFRCMIVRCSRCSRFFFSGCNSSCWNNLYEIFSLLLVEN